MPLIFEEKIKALIAELKAKDQSAPIVDADKEDDAEAHVESMKGSSVTRNGGCWLLVGAESYFHVQGSTECLGTRFESMFLLN